MENIIYLELPLIQVKLCAYFRWLFRPNSTYIYRDDDHQEDAHHFMSMSHIKLIPKINISNTTSSDFW